MLNSLSENGFVVFPGIFFLSDSTKKNIRQSKFRNIFNSINRGILQYTSDRQQSSASEKWCASVTKKLRVTLSQLNLFDSNIQRITHVLALKSIKGCKKQAEHCDSAPMGYFDNEKIFPMACVVALEANTKIYIRSRKTNREECIYMNEGDILVFRGDVKHCGADYKKQNIRLFAYIDIKSYSRPKNKTFL